MTLILTLYSAHRPPQEALVSGLPSHSLPYEFSFLLPGVTANPAADAVQAFVTSVSPPLPYCLCLNAPLSPCRTGSPGSWLDLLQRS